MSDEIKFVQVSSKEAIHQGRLELLREIDGDIFYRLFSWPNEIKMAFCKKPIGDEDAFKLGLFLFDNGCPPAHTKNWIVSSTFWEKNKTRKRWEQVNWVLENISTYERKWFYFDLHLNKYVFMDRSDRAKLST